MMVAKMSSMFSSAAHQAEASFCAAGCAAHTACALSMDVAFAASIFISLIICAQIVILGISLLAILLLVLVILALLDPPPPRRRISIWNLY